MTCWERLGISTTNPEAAEQVRRELIEVTDQEVRDLERRLRQAMTNEVPGRMLLNRLRLSTQLENVRARSAHLAALPPAYEEHVPHVHVDIEQVALPSTRILAPAERWMQRRTP